MIYNKSGNSMNQILSTKMPKNKKYWYQVQFTISIVCTLLTLVITIYYFFNLIEEEKNSNRIIDNYNIYKLYSESSNTHDNSTDNTLFGVIEIPEIEIYYPIFSQLNENLLKIAPCKFYGESLDQTGNICIAGHNYDNSMFFSKISSLKMNDEIFIFNTFGKKYTFYVEKIYEVSSSDLSPIFNYDKKQKNLTLITCNNLNSNRIILRAKQKSF